MKKLINLVLAALMLLSSAACSSTNTPSSTKFEAGVYTASAEGMRGTITLDVTFDETSITSIEVKESNETVMIGDSAITLMAERIIDAQSVNVDLVSGATVTSAAVKNIVLNAAEQANNPEGLNREVKIETKDETFDYDVIVAGGGLSGLVAAAKATQEGAKVALIEKEDQIGGTSVMAEGYFFSVAPNTEEELLAEFNRRASLSHSDTYPLQSMLEVLVDNNTAALDFMRSTGCDIKVLKNFTSIATTETGEIDTSARSAYRLIQFLSEYILNNGSDIYVATPATSLILADDGSVTGVISESKTGLKTFNAKSVVLATGDFARNKEMLAEYIPQSENCYTITAVGNTGDGIILALSAGGVVYDDMYVQGGPLIFDPTDIYRGSYSSPQFLKNSMLVSLSGDRRMGEDQGTRPIHYVYTNYNEADGAWSIMDSAMISALDVNIEELVQQTNENTPIQAYKADTIFDLALQTGMLPEVFIRNVERYNSFCETGVDEDFNKSAEYLEAIDEGPFYAIRGYAINRGTLGGIQTNESAEVINAENQAIAGLYAAGTLSSRPFFSRTYDGGSALGISATMGYVAGVHAAEYALTK